MSCRWGVWESDDPIFRVFAFTSETRGPSDTTPHTKWNLIDFASKGVFKTFYILYGFQDISSSKSVIIIEKYIVASNI